MSTKEAQTRAKAKWRKKAIMVFQVNLNRENDADIIQKLDDVPNKAGYVKGLIRDDIAKEGKP